jgi:hypothetical protein
VTSNHEFPLQQRERRQPPTDRKKADFKKNQKEFHIDHELFSRTRY